MIIMFNKTLIKSFILWKMEKLGYNSNWRVVMANYVSNTSTSLHRFDDKKSCDLSNTCQGAIVSMQIVI